MIIIVLSLTSASILGYGILRYAWLVRGAEDGPTAAMTLWIIIVWWAVSLVPALCAAGLTVAWFGDLSGLTRVIGLASALLLLLPIPPLAAFLIWEDAIDRLELREAGQAPGLIDGISRVEGQIQGAERPVGRCSRIAGIARTESSRLGLLRVPSCSGHIGTAPSYHSARRTQLPEDQSGYALATQ